MRSIVRIAMIVVALTLSGFESAAQEKKNECDVAYVSQKKQMDAQRTRDVANKRKNDSLQKFRLHDSLAEVRRSDSVRYSKMGVSDTAKPAEPTKRDSIYRNIPLRIEKGDPPKGPHDAEECALPYFRWRSLITLY